MNNKYLIFLRNVLLSGLAIVVLTLFSSCENFLKGNHVKSQLEELIAYENALTHQLIVRSDPAMGSFLSEGEKDCKLGFTTTLQFTMNTDDYVFHGFEAVCVNDTTQSRSDCVEFTINQAESDPSKGIYKVTVKLLKAANDILIRPVCVLIPAVVYYEPESKSPNYLNTPIVIHFNMPMDPLNVLEKDNQGNYKNIFIEYLGENLLGKFEKPSFDSSNTNLFLYPKGGELKEFFKDKETAYYEIDITLKNIFVLQNVDGKDYNLSLKGNNNSDYSFIVRYRYATEDSKPVQYIFKATRHEISIDSIDELEEDDEFKYGSLNLSMSLNADEVIIAREDQLHNRAGEVIYLYGVFYDADSGIRAVRINEHHTKEPFYAEDVNINGKDDKTTYYYINDKNQAVQWVDYGDGYVTFCIKHYMKSQNGAVNITVEVLDGAGNTPEEKDAYDHSINNTFTVIKRDYSNFYAPDTFYYRLYNGGFDRNNVWPDYISHKYSDDEIEFDSTEYNNHLKKLYLNSLNDVCGLCSLYGWTTIPIESMTIQCRYINKYNKEITANFVPVDIESEENYYWELDLDVEKIGGTELTLIVADDMGNRAEVKYTIPESSSISYKKDGNNVSFFSSSGYPIIGLLQVRDEAYAKTIFSDNIDIAQNNNYKICPRFNLYNGCFYTEISDLEINSNSVSDSLEYSIQNCQVHISESPRDGSRVLDVTVTIDDDAWNKFDAIYADFSNYYYIPEVDGAYSRKHFVKGDNSIKVKIFDNYLYAEEYTCTVYGIKNNRVSSGKEVKFGPVTGIQYDNTPPDMDYTLPFYSKPYVEITITDEQSGPDHGIISINGYEHYFEGDSIKIYDWDINLDSDSRLQIIAETYDKAGNKGKGSAGTGIQWFPVTSIEKQSTLWNLFITSKTTAGFTKQYLSDGTITSYYLNTDGTWTKCDDQKLRTKVSEREIINGLYTIKASNLTLPADKFVKIIHHVPSGNYSYPTYFYTGTIDPQVNTGAYDMVLPYSTSTSKVIISSDGPVFVHTVVTDRGYEVCKNWDVKEWEFYKKSIGETYIDFTINNAQQKYEIPISEITSGQCYVVIAHFANGKTEMSDVFQMP